MIGRTRFLVRPSFCVAMHGGESSDGHERLACNRDADHRTSSAIINLINSVPLSARNMIVLRIGSLPRI